MPAFLCAQCGTQFAESPAPPPSCPICVDERQFVRWTGQAWMTAEELAAGHEPSWLEEEGLLGLAIEPEFPIGQRALLVPGAGGLLMWDCVALITPAIVDRIRAEGGLSAIAISHPHYYTTCGLWSDGFSGIPVYLHEDDRAWVMRPHPAIVRWSGDTLELSPGLTLIRCGGHFAGATVLHWREGAGGRGALLVGDVAQVAMDRSHLSFMRSYPNYIPLGPKAVRRIRDALAPFEFDTIYGAFRNRNIVGGGREAFDRSVTRYLRAIEAE